MIETVKKETSCKQLFIVIQNSASLYDINTSIEPYLRKHGVRGVQMIPINHYEGRTNDGKVEYDYLVELVKDTFANNEDKDIVITTYMTLADVSTTAEMNGESEDAGNRIKVETMQNKLKEDIGNSRFIPYIRADDFEGMDFASEDIISDMANQIFRMNKEDVRDYDTEDLNDFQRGIFTASPTGNNEDDNAVIKSFLKSFDMTFPILMKKCKPLKAWIDAIMEACKE
jgi:hypothetical protein